MTDREKIEEAYERVREAQKEIHELKKEIEEKIVELTKKMKTTGIGCSLKIDRFNHLPYKAPIVDLLNFMFPGEFKNVKKYSQKYDEKIEELLGIDPDEICELSDEFGFEFPYKTEGWTASGWGC